MASDSVIEDDMPTQALRLRGKRAIVTAAANGIGRAVAMRLAAEGAQVFAADLDAQALSTMRSRRIETATLDFTAHDAVRKAVSKFGRLDVLVNCVGWVHQGDILNCNFEDWKRSFSLNLDTMFVVIRAALPSMIAQGAGSIVNIASIASSVKAVPNRAAYSATKAGVIGLTKAVSADVVSKGVRCNAICPGTIMSPSLQQRINSASDPEQAKRDFIGRQPMGRLGEPEEVAGLCAYLAADESRFMTGAVLVLDGGMAA